MTPQLCWIKGGVRPESPGLQWLHVFQPEIQSVTEQPRAPQGPRALCSHASLVTRSFHLRNVA